MVARGDLGVEVPFTELPAIQKQPHHHLPPARQARHHGDGDARIHDPQPAPHARGDLRRGQRRLRRLERRHAFRRDAPRANTRCSPWRPWPPSSSETEQHINYEKRFRNTEFQINSLLDAISHATCGMAIDIGAKCHRRQFAVRPDGADGLALPRAHGHHRHGHEQGASGTSWPFRGACIPVLSEQFKSTDVLFYHAQQASPSRRSSSSQGDKVVMTGGITNGTSGNTNLIKVETI